MPFDDYGYINGWQDVPEAVKNCRLKKHKTSEINLDLTMRGLDTEVKCYECGIVYHVDSSD